MRMSAWSRTRPCDRNSTDELGCAQILLSSKASSVSEAAERRFELAVDRTALAQHPRQAEHGQKHARPRSRLMKGERGQVGGLSGRTAQRPAQPGRPQGVADLDT